MAFREQLSFQLAGSLLRFANTKLKHLQTTLAYGLTCTHKVVVGLQLRNIQAEILSTASYTHWALFLAVCSWSLLGSRYVCRQLPHGLIADIKSSQSKLFFFFFFSILLFVYISHYAQVFQKMRKETKGPGVSLPLHFQGLTSLAGNVVIGGSLLFVSALPFAHEWQSYPLFPFAQYALVLVVKMVCYLLHRGIARLSQQSEKLFQISNQVVLRIHSISGLPYGYQRK